MSKPRYEVREVPQKLGSRYAVLDTKRVIYVRYLATKAEAEADAASRNAGA
jgi:hypothetical protein